MHGKYGQRTGHGLPYVMYRTSTKNAPGSQHTTVATRAASAASLRYRDFVASFREVFARMLPWQRTLPRKSCGTTTYGSPNLPAGKVCCSVGRTIDYGRT